MWKCHFCAKAFDDSKMTIELRFGFIDSEAMADKKDKDYFHYFYPEEGLLPLCDDCAISYIKGEINDYR